jgi:succinate-semialdehyde dehydrogenase/glutarate-semialdehyde dehydrogenase
MPIQSVNPANGSLLRSFNPLPAELLEAKIGQAHAAFRPLGQVPIAHRALWMLKLACILEYETEDLATLIATEMGKTITAARQEILNCAGCCRYFAQHAAAMLEKEAIPMPQNSCSRRWDPLGVLLAVMPWNSPFWQVFRFLSPALMAGNVVLLKHSSTVPQCAMEIELLVRRAGFPRGSFQTLLIESSQVESVLSDRRVAAVTVTGTETTGRALAAQAGWLIKPVALQLGSSDPFIVMPSANLSAAIRAGVAARCADNGQTCTAATRFLVHEAVYDDFLPLFAAAMEDLKVGNPMKDETELGPLATTQVLKDLEAQVAAAVQAGGRVVTGGERMLGVGNFFEPTIIAGVPQTAAVCQEEIVGPLALLFKVGSLDEAIQCANHTPYGLGASVWTSDEDEQARFAAELECGSIFINASVYSDPRLPVGGAKRSGYGRELSAAGMRAFMNAKTVVIGEPASQSEEGILEALSSLESHLNPGAALASGLETSISENFNDILEHALQGKR